ncbi:hypothetical protein ACIQW5_10485 [Methylorubrum thiocyanatum]|uniref:hypothetical protein n=1 Tax=Methylorubrum thiocyanatum TaxID=47958 RepID=UPI00383A0E04
MWRTPTYNSWRAMKDRCTQTSHRSYQHYGERAITYTQDWETFEGFLADMGERPEGMTLDRIDGDRPYCKDNCRWSDRTTQNRNRRTNVRVTYNGQTRVLSEWAEIIGIPYARLRARIVRLGWSPEHAFKSSVRPQVTISLTYEGRMMTTAEWAKQTGIPNSTLRYRIMGLGWDVERALTTPPKK